MEVLVDVVRVRLEGMDDSHLRGAVLECKAMIGDEECIQQASPMSPIESRGAGPSNREPPRQRNDQGQCQWPLFKLQFHTRAAGTANPNATLTLTLFTNRSPADSEITEISSCKELLMLQQVDHRLVEFHGLSASQTRIGLLGSLIEGTDVTRFVGKVWFKVSHALLSPAVLQSKELEDTCHNTFPSNVPTVSVVFHCLTSTTQIETREQLSPLACLGPATVSSSNVSDVRVLQSSGRGSAVNSILKPVTLACDNQASLELHIADTAADSVIFSASHQLQELNPFQHYHWQYDLRCTPSVSATPDLPPSAEQSIGGPTVIVSVSYIPSMAQHALYEGLELFISGLNLPSNLQGHSVVLSTRLLSSNSKTKVPSSKTFNPPFPKSKVKGRRADSENYNLSVVRFQGSGIQLGENEHRIASGERILPSSTKPAYFFFSKDLHFAHDHGNSDITVSIMVYAIDPASPLPWWETQLVASSNFLISTAAQRALQEPANQTGLYWEVTGEGISQPNGRVLTNKICGVVRWKSVQTPFLGKSIESGFHDLPNLLELTEQEAQCSRAQSPSPLAPNAPQLQAQGQPAPLSRQHRSHLQPAAPLQQQGLTVPVSPHQDYSPIALPVPEMIGNVSSLLAEHETISDAAQEHESARLAEYKAAIDTLGRDIKTLRQQNSDLMEQNKELRGEIARMQSTASAISPADQKVLESMPKPELIQKIMEIQQRLSVESESRKCYQDRVQTVQNTLIQKNEIEMRYIELQEVHKVQQQLVRHQQAKIVKYRKCGVLCKQQEALISQLESLLAQQAEAHGNSEVVSVLTRENAQLRAAVQEYFENEPENKSSALREKEDVIQSLRLQVSELTEKCCELEEQRSWDREARSKEAEIFELQQELAVTEARVSTLRNQLQENARRWAAKEAQYEVQIAEYQTRIAGETVLDSQHIPAEASSLAGEQNTRRSETRFPVSERPKIVKPTF